MILVNVVLYLQWDILMLVQTARWSEVYLLEPAAVFFSRVVIHIGSLVPYAIAGICFLWWSGHDVDSVSLTPREGDAVESADLRNMEIVFVAALGLYLLADGFAVLCSSVIEGLSDLFRDFPLSILISRIETIVQALVKLTLGFFLVFGRAGFVAVLHRVHAWVRRWRAWPEEVPLSER
jgi:hypothetical protein